MIKYVFLIIAFGLGGWYYLKKRYLTMEDTPTSKIRSAAQGYVELSGKCGALEGEELLVAPFSGKPCIWWRYYVRNQSQSDRSEALFLIKDGTGQCIIDPAGADVITLKEHSGSWNAWAPTQSNTMVDNVVGKFEYVEYRIEPGEDVTAIGLFETVRGSGETFDTNAKVRDLLSEWKHDSHKLLEKFDTNKDGKISMDEWQAVRKAALEEVMRKRKEWEKVPPHNMLIHTQDKKRPFIISSDPDSRKKNMGFLRDMTLGLVMLYIVIPGILYILGWLIIDFFNSLAR